MFKANPNNIADFYTPAETCDIFYGNQTPGHTKLYKGVINPTNNKLLSVVSNRYKLVTNEELIKNLMETLEKVDCKYYIDPSHSFVSDKRMRMQLVFPDLFLKDEESKIPFSLYIHNSYDHSEGVRIIAGAIRAICSNGMIFGNVMQKFYHKHYRGIDLEEMKRNFDFVYNKFPDVQERINILNEIAAKPSIKEELEDFSEDFCESVNIDKKLEERITLWQLYNLMTYWISHHTTLRQMAKYQAKASRIIGL